MAFSKSSDKFGDLAGPATTIAVTLPTVNTGDFIYVMVKSVWQSGITISVSDTNASYTPKKSITDGANVFAQQFFLKNSAAATNLVVTATITSTTAIVMYAAAWAGADTTTGFDVEAGQVQSAPGTGTDAVTSTAVSTNDKDLILGICNDSINSFTLTEGTGFTLVTDFNGVNVGQETRSEELVQGAAGNQAATFTASDGTSRFSTLLMAVFPSGHGGGPTVDQLVPAYTQTGGTWYSINV